MQPITGTIVSLTPDAMGREATIDIDGAAVCSRCASGKGCGAGLFGAGGGQRRLDAALPAGSNWQVGDRVSVELQARNMLAAAGIVYGWPLLGAVAGAALAYQQQAGDSGAALAALAGLGLGLWLAQRKLAKNACLQRFSPQIRSIDA